MLSAQLDDAVASHSELRAPQNQQSLIVMRWTSVVSLASVSAVLEQHAEEKQDW